MDKEKMNGKELTEKEMEQVRGGWNKVGKGDPECLARNDDGPCVSIVKGQLGTCATCSKHN